jgi:uncharacterized protein
MHKKLLIVDDEAHIRMLIEQTLEDLEEGMILKGVVTNVTRFGAFVDVGVHQDGLVHISQLADRFVDDPKKVVKVGQIVKVRVLEVNEPLKRIALSMKKGFKRSAKSTTKKKKPASQKSAASVHDLIAKFNRRENR